VTRLANEEFERRLSTDPESISTEDLVVAAGVSADKISRYEGWGSDREQPGQNFNDVMARLSALNLGTQGKQAAFQRTQPSRRVATRRNSRAIWPIRGTLPQPTCAAEHLPNGAARVIYPIQDSLVGLDECLGELRYGFG
jgi:hypothetical protein